MKTVSTIRRTRLRYWRLIALRVCSIVLDMTVTGFALVSAYMIVLQAGNVAELPRTLMLQIAGFVAISLATYLFFGIHRASWRYVSMPDLVNIAKAVLSAIALYTLTLFLVSRGANVPRSVILLTVMFVIVGWAVPRVAYRLFAEGYFVPIRSLRLPPDTSRHVLILGFTGKAESFIRAWRKSHVKTFKIAGVLESMPISNSGTVQGMKIVGNLETLPKVVAKFRKKGIPVSEIIVAEVSPSRRRLSDIVQTANSLGLKTTRIPDLTEPELIADDKVVEPKPIELRDLLGRPEVENDHSAVAPLIEEKTVLVTGAGGSIGSELILQIATFKPSKLVLVDSSEHNTYLIDQTLRERHPQLDVVTRLLDIRDDIRLDMVFSELRPQVVFHAAALKHVPLVEDNPLEGIKTNVLGTRNTADAAMRYGAEAFVMISTDKAVNPTNVMGATKRLAEAYCQASDLQSRYTRFKTVRFGNVLGSSGSVVPRFQEQIRNGGPVTVTHPKIVRYFMTIPEAVRLVLAASSHVIGANAARGKIMVLDMGEPVRIVDLAERMIQLAGLRPGHDIPIVFTGLRPGEKLYEELFDPSEIQESKSNKGYFIANPRVIDLPLLVRAINRLEHAVAKGDAAMALSLLQEFIPEYKGPAMADSTSLGTTQPVARLK